MSEDDPVIQARGLEKRFGPVPALRSLNLDVPRGASLAVLGPNGAGKSTLLRLLAGLTQPSAGALRVGEPSASRVERRRRVGLIAHATFLYPALTARENLVLAGRLHGLAEPIQRADRLLEELELVGVAQQRAGTFSRGMAQRLAIARALVHDPPVLLLDEPFTGLDPRAAERLAERLADVRSSATTAVLVTHDLGRAAELSDAGLVLVAGCARPLPSAAMASPQALAASYRETVSELEATATGRAA